MRGYLLCRSEALLGLLLILLFSGNFCYASASTVEVVGIGECADCKENDIKTSHALSGLKVTIDCKLEDGKFQTRGVGELDSEGHFKVSLSQEILKDGKLAEECYTQLHNAANAPCAVHSGLEASKITFLSKSNEKHTFGPTGKLKFSSAVCTSAFLWPVYKHPWFKKFGHPPISLPPKIPFKKPCPPPVVKPPPVPVYKPTPKPPVVELPPVPVYKPTPKPPVYKPTPKPPVYKPTPKPPVVELPPVPVYKPTPKPPVVKPPCPPVPVYKPKPPVYKPAPVPVYKPKPPVYKPKPLPPPIPIYKPLPPPIPIYKPLPPPIPIYKPHPKILPPPIPIYKPLPPFYKKPCPPFSLPKLPPKHFHHPIIPVPPHP